jgi:hypothetical protein
MLALIHGHAFALRHDVGLKRAHLGDRPATGFCPGPGFRCSAEDRDSAAASPIGCPQNAAESGDDIGRERDTCQRTRSKERRSRAFYANARQNPRVAAQWRRKTRGSISRRPSRDRDVIPRCTALRSDYGRLPSGKLERCKAPQGPARICELRAACLPRQNGHSGQGASGAKPSPRVPGRVNL